MTRWIISPLTAFGITILIAAVLGKDKLKEYSIGAEHILFEEYLIVFAIVIVYNVIITIRRRGKNDD